MSSQNILDEPELWKPIYKAPYYEISNYGAVRSWRNSTGDLVEEPRIVRPGLNRRRTCLDVLLRVNGQYRSRRVHILVLEAFVGVRPIKSYVGIHIDENIFNNRSSNLKWVPYNYTRRSTTKLSTDDVIKIRGLSAAGLPDCEIAKQFPVSYDLINKIVNHKRWKNVG